MRKTASLLFMLMLFCGSVFSQDETRKISGKIISSSGYPIPFASIVEANENNGTTADVNGAFSLTIKTTNSLVISATGFETLTISPTGSTITITLKEKAGEMAEVIVTTGLGIKRKSDLLAYSTQGVKGADLTSTRLTDVNTALAGKVSNVQIRTQSAAKLGSQSQIRIRGANSVANLSNDPLYVVDGTPLDDINFINMDDVEEIQVLKGPSASAIYGQRGQNGVILITTKKAKSNSMNISVTSTFSADKVGRLAKYQNEYSGGSAGAGWQTYTWQPGDPVEWQALNGKRYHTYFDDASWGPKMDGSEYIPWYAWYPGTQYSFKTASLVPQPDNVKEFYNTGKNFLNNISLSKGGSDYLIRLSYTNQSQTGLIPESRLDRNYISTQLSYDASQHFTVSANINYVNQKIQGEFSDTYGNNTSGSFNQWFHRDIDMGIMKELKDFRTPTGRIPGWNLDDGNGVSGAAFYKGTAYWTNPYTYYDLLSAINVQDRLYGDASLTYKLNEHFKVAGIVRRNQRNTHYESKLPYIFQQSTVDFQSPLAINANLGSRPVTATYRTYDVRQVENNYEFLASYNQKFGSITVDANFGGNVRQNEYSSLDNGTRGGLVIPDLYTLSNSVVQPFYTANTRTKKIVRSLYGRASANWNDMVIVDVTLRNDWSSALPANNNSYLYPSVGGSFIFTKFVDKALPWISFGKVRATWAQVGSDLDPYELDLLYSVGANQWNGNITTTTPNTAIDSVIKPQLSTSVEFGLDMRFLKNRIGFSATYYNDNTVDAIMSVTTSSTSGFSAKRINAGKLVRKGFEFNIDGYVVRNRDFSYNISFNFATNTSTVEELYPGLNNLYLGGSDYSSATGAAAYAPGVWSTVGGEWGQIRGRGIKRIDGIPVLNANGTYQYTDNLNFGSVLPDFTGGMINTLSYKRFSLNFTIDFVKGGKFFSLSDHWGSVSGLYDYTAGLNDKGNPVRDDVSAGGGVHVVGVDANKAPIDMYVDVFDYYITNNLNRINELHVFDLTYVKMREINFGYNIPVKSLGNVGNYIKNLQLSVFARNPFLIYTANKNFDPSELTGNYGESGQLPPSRTFGATLKFDF